MITEASVFIRDEIQSYLLKVNAVPRSGDVLLGNIAMLENNVALANKVIITMVNVEEESTLKNTKNWSHNSLTGNIETSFPPVYLNLYLLFTASLPDTVGENDEPYQNALDRIAAIVEFFQSKKVFTIQSSPGFEARNLKVQLLSQIRLVPELYTLTFEQINHLWGSLGGKQSPFVMYKIRLVKIQSSIVDDAPLIESIQVDSNETEISSN